MISDIQDPLFEEAANLVVASQIGSTSLLQRRLKIDYQRSLKLIGKLQEAGIVGPDNGIDASRNVLIKTYKDSRKNLDNDSEISREMAEFKLQAEEQNKLLHNQEEVQATTNKEIVRKQIIEHKSDWGRNAIKVLIGIAAIFMLYRTNPSQQKFQQYIIKEYAEKEGLDPMWTQVLANNTPLFIDNFVERNDYVFFSTYSFSYRNKKMTALGIANNFIPIEDSTMKQQP